MLVLGEETLCFPVSLQASIFGARLEMLMIALSGCLVRNHRVQKISQDVSSKNFLSPLDDQDANVSNGLLLST